MAASPLNGYAKHLAVVFSFHEDKISSADACCAVLFVLFLQSMYRYGNQQNLILWIGGRVW